MEESKMKTQILLVIYICFFSTSLFGQKDISGTYYNEAGMQVKIEDNKYTYIIAQSHSPIYSSDTLAECSIKRIDKNFIEINSVSPLISIRKGLQVSQNFEEIIGDSIKVIFLIPYDFGDLIVSIYTDLTFQKLCELHYSEKNNTIMLPKTIKSFFYGFEPQLSSIKTHNTEGLFYGIMRIEPLLECIIEKDKNTVEINIPTLHNSFFEKYYVKGEYVMVTRNKIKWRGDVFIKN